MAITVKLDLFGIEDDAATAGRRWPPWAERRLLPLIDRTNGSLPAEAEAVLPEQFHLAARPSTSVVGLTTVAPCGCANSPLTCGGRQLARRRGAERRPAAFHHRDGPAAHVLLFRSCAAEVCRQNDVGPDGAQLGSQRRLDALAASVKSPTRRSIQPASICGGISNS